MDSPKKIEFTVTLTADVDENTAYRFAMDFISQYIYRTSDQYTAFFGDYSPTIRVSDPKIMDANQND